MSIRIKALPVPKGLLKLAAFWLVLELTSFLAAQAYFAAGFKIITDNCEKNTFTCRTVIQPHPYAGFSRLDRSEQSVYGEEGFAFVQKLPIQREAGAHYIGIFGASVAEDFCFYFEREAPELRNYFASHYQVAPEKIKFACFANSGYKQPQQMILASLYAQELDFALNLEGCSEISNTVMDGYPNQYPDPNLAAYIYFAKSSSQFEQTVGALLVKPYEWSQVPAQIPLPSIRVAQIMVNKLTWYWATTMHREGRNGKDEAESTQIAEQNRGDWMRYARLNMTFLKSLKKDFLYIVQPYLPLKSAKSAAEQALIEERRGDLLNPHLKAFQKARAELDSWTEFKRNFFDSTDIFEGVQDGVFRDFCHLKRDGKGREIFTRKLIDRLRFYFASTQK